MNSTYTLIESEETLKRIQKLLEETSVIGFDIETTGLDYFSDKILLIQFMICNEVFILDVINSTDKLVKFVLTLFKELNIKIICHNGKFDLNFIYYKYGILFENVYCTMIGEFVLTGGLEKFSSLDSLTKKYLDYYLDKEIRDKFIGATEVALEMLIYSANDVKPLEEIMYKQLGVIEERGLMDILSLEHKVLPVLVKMEINGVKLDKEQWTSLYLKAKKKVEVYDEKIKELIFTYFYNEILPKKIEDLDSKKVFDNNKLKDLVYNFLYAKCLLRKKGEFESLKDIFDFLFITYKKNTKEEKERISSISVNETLKIKKEFFETFKVSSYRQLKRAFNVMGVSIDSTEKKILKKLKRKGNLFAEYLLEYRNCYKKATTYGLEFLSHVKSDGRIHANFNQTGTATGRLSSSSPNLQNIIGGEGYRKSFIAEDGKRLITVDYSQQEFRLAGEISGEKTIIEAYQKGKDMHVATGALLFEIPLEDVTKEQRSNGKTVNFAVLYGTSAWGLARTMGISEEKAEAILEIFHVNYPRLSGFMANVHNSVWENRYSVTPLGRRRNFDSTRYRTNGFIEGDYKEYLKFKGRLEREAFNHITQGGSADMMKLALWFIDRDCPWNNDEFKLIMTVHDEVTAEVYKRIAEKAEEFIRQKMIEAGEVFLKEIPVDVSSSISKHWSK